ncbi:hypothetical protein [Glycomyces halotolerans]
MEVPGDGHYDWAGRRLFLADGSPDPDTPGAYRYQHRPDCCDPAASDDDPASPWYEPPYLRHRPGDTWQIGGKPEDPLDPGPFGSPGWYQDRRTGRHRRGELPDPLPPDDPSQASQVSAWIRLNLPAPAPVIEVSRPSVDDSATASEPASAGEPPPERAGLRSSSLREDAWQRFLIGSEPLARAHIDGRARLHRRKGRFTRFRHWVADRFRPAAPAERPTAAPARGTARVPPVAAPRHGAYIAGWEHAFDTNRAFGTGTF